MPELDQALNDLIWQREKLNAGLEAELNRSQRIATATNALRDLNDKAQSIVVDTLQRIGAWPQPIEQSPLNTLQKSLRASEVANGVANAVFRKVA